MYKYSIILFLVIITLQGLSQKRANLSIQVAYGIVGNFFVRSYEEINPTANTFSFYKKKFIGQFAEIGLMHRITKKSTLNLFFSKSNNNKIINFKSQNVNIIDYQISHINNFYQLSLQSMPFKKSHFLFEEGIYYLRVQQQEVDVSPTSAFFEQRNFKNSRLEEAGIFLAIGYKKHIDTKFDIGLKSKLY